MATTIEVSKQSVKDLLATGKKHKFVIPEYQRPYAWSADQIQTLFDDLVENDNESTYFLGTIVAYENEDHEQEIIDGQQRITSLFLFLRALYAKLSSMTETKETNNFKQRIEAALWEQDELTGEPDFEKVLISSRVMGDEGNEVFASILINGVADENATDNYSKNYNLFVRLIQDYASVELELFWFLIRNVLDRAIMLPITADSQETALTIFSTLNDRGLALSDADIFKAKIYNHLSKADKADFIQQWQELDDEAINAAESIQKLFYYYMFFLRAEKGDRNTSTPGIRKYYSQENFTKLYDSRVMDDLKAILNLWVVTNNRVGLEDEEWSNDIGILKTLDTLASYPNEFWKYPVVIYYLKYREDMDFSSKFSTFLHRLLAILSARYIVTPTINAVKSGILNLNAEIIKSDSPKFEFNPIDELELKQKIKTAHKNTVRMILKELAYQHQDRLLPEKWEIEHILPQKWQDTYFPGVGANEVRELVEHIGNKIPFEKKLNITASNGYFQKKRNSYDKSEVEILRTLSEGNSDWGLDEIRERDLRIADELVDLLNGWGLNGTDEQYNHLTPIPEERFNDYQAFVTMFKLPDDNDSREQFLQMGQQGQSGN